MRLVAMREGRALDPGCQPPYITNMSKRLHSPEPPRPAKCRWCVVYLRSTPARELASIGAPDDPVAAHALAIEVFRIRPEQAHRVMVLRED